MPARYRHRSHHPSHNGSRDRQSRSGQGFAPPDCSPAPHSMLALRRIQTNLRRNRCDIPGGPVPVFSRTMFASATAPKSQPARVYGTQGAGAFSTGHRRRGADRPLVLASLMPDERAIAVVDPVAPPDILSGNGRRAEPGNPDRHPPRRARSAARAGLEALVATTSTASTPGAADAAWDRIVADGLPDVTLRVGRPGRARPGPLLRDPRAAVPHRVRQHPERREPHPRGLARPGRRLGRGHPRRALPRRPSRAG